MLGKGKGKIFLVSGTGGLFFFNLLLNIVLYTHHQSSLLSDTSCFFFFYVHVLFLSYPLPFTRFFGLWGRNSAHAVSLIDPLAGMDKGIGLYDCF